MRIGIFTDTYLPYISGLVASELMLKKALEDNATVSKDEVNTALNNFYNSYEETVKNYLEAEKDFDSKAEGTEEKTEAEEKVKSLKTK